MKIFNATPRAKVQKSVFDLSHEKKMSIDFGKLYPCYLEEVVPGDDFKIQTQSLIRMSPLVSPVMHRINAYIHYFYVPNHILWPDWDEFVSQDYSGERELVPHHTLNMVISPGELADYLGIPPGNYSPTRNPGETHQEINILPFLAYFCIWNEYYRDENLMTKMEMADLIADTDLMTFAIKFRAWGKDYFTSCLPYAQKGGTPYIEPQYKPNEPSVAYRIDGGVMPEDSVYTKADDGNLFLSATSPTEEIRIEDPSFITPEQIRTAEKIQRYLEKLYRSGHRYIEYLRGVWGQSSDDLRLMRPQYIGGGVSPVVISEVLNNSTTTDEPLGTMGGHGINVGISNQASVYCKYHGWIMGILSVIPEPLYMQGLPKHFSRLDPFDYYIPDLAQLGEQAVLKKELYLSPLDEAYNEQTFGYQSRFAEMKYGKSMCHGAFRDTLAFWTLVRKFEEGSKPVLNEQFLECEPSGDIFAIPELGLNEQMYVSLLHNVTAVRPMPFFNTPGLP